MPEGRYRLTKTINVWPSIRLIGYGGKRPVFVLAANTPGTKTRTPRTTWCSSPAAGQARRSAGALPPRGGRNPARRPGAAGRAGRAGQAGTRPPDSGPGTFYSAMSNIDIEIGEGNPGAVGVRGTYAQHSFLAHMDFRIGSGIAGVHDTGNVMEDVRFFGGQYGIWTRTPSPGWQFTGVDLYFEGQTGAAIRDRAAGLTLVRPHFRNVPTAVSIDVTITTNSRSRTAAWRRSAAPP